MDSKARNPNFTWNVLTQQPVTAAESAFLHLIFGTDGNIPAAYLYEFLANERLPTALGWKTPAEQIDLLKFTPVTGYYLKKELIGFGLEHSVAEELAETSVKRWVSRQ